MESVTNPVDPDVDVCGPAGRREVRPSPWPVLAVISAGGVLGALARYGLQQAFPHRAEQFGFATFGINAAGCLLIGVLMALITELWPGRRLLRPFLGVGVLGGFTTFSTYVVDIQQALAAGAARTALAYLAATVLAALLAVWTGATLTARALQRRPRTPRKAGAAR
ncbi:fluoride efflux transporter FluC [Amycolatopsis thermoflava]|uniref:fluoride efflux transporter FluC n=1 Tax=Amycolatopsis thermoflava TaxID=84480 RepID=UPI000401230A|nr:CrcB family protein [Amycolatopsis thermoflava]